MQVHRVSEPFSQLAPVDVELLLSTGVPIGAIIDGRRLDIAMLRQLGWNIEPDALTPPTTTVSEGVPPAS
jgi:hypothetical protein